MSELAKSGHVSLASEQVEPRRIRVQFSWTKRRSQPAVALTVIATDEEGRAISPDHHVSYQDPTLKDGRRTFELLMDLESAPEEAAAVAFNLVASSRSLRDLPGLTASVRDQAGELLVEYPIRDLARERSLLALELHRRTGEWRVHAAGEPRPDGRVGLLRSFGIDP
ncbi:MULTISPECIES: TerD family protein [unclassified Blastococcus]